MSGFLSNVRRSSALHARTGRRYFLIPTSRLSSTTYCFICNSFATCEDAPFGIVFGYLDKDMRKFANVLWYFGEFSEILVIDWNAICVGRRFKEYYLFATDVYHWHQGRSILCSSCLGIELCVTEDSWCMLSNIRMCLLMHNIWMLCV